MAGGFFFRPVSTLSAICLLIFLDIFAMRVYERQVIWNA